MPAHLPSPGSQWWLAIITITIINAMIKLQYYSEIYLELVGMSAHNRRESRGRSWTPLRISQYRGATGMMTKLMERAGMGMTGMGAPAMGPGMMGGTASMPAGMNMMMVPRCTMTMEKCTGGMKITCTCEDAMSAGMLQNLCTMMAGGM